MPTQEEELQAAADRGELQAKNTTAIKRQLDTSERRWIVMQVKEVAIAHDMDAEQFTDMCEAIYKFVAGPFVGPSATD